MASPIGYKITQYYLMCYSKIPKLEKMLDVFTLRASRCPTAARRLTAAFCAALCLEDQFRILVLHPACQAHNKLRGWGSDPPPPAPLG